MRVALTALLAALLVSLAAPAGASAPAPEDRNQACLICHNDPALSITLRSGERLSLHVDPARFKKSIHGDRLACVDCHTALSGVPLPHAAVRLESRRAFTTRYYESCRRCHFANYTRTLDSVHFEALLKGRDGSPVCSDCHGSHYVEKPGTKDSTACGGCHSRIHASYAGSVHGKALLEEGNPDVPACTSCHGVHSIEHASSDAFRLASTQACARCHADPTLMARYGLSPRVLKTYLQDFHGRTVGFRQHGSSGALREPLCVDCHGIHDIKSARDPASPVMHDNLQKTCASCHRGASPKFSAAWMGHYEPSLRKSPLVYLIRVYYRVLIPFLIGGLLIHIGLDLMRIVRNR